MDRRIEDDEPQFEQSAIAVVRIMLDEHGNETGRAIDVDDSEMANLCYVVGMRYVLLSRTNGCATLYVRSTATKAQVDTLVAELRSKLYAAALASGKVAASTFQQAGITPKQESFLNSLLAERPMYRDVENLFLDVVAKMTKADASAKIGEVLKVAKETAKAEAAAPTSVVPEGYYAIDMDGTVKFYRVDCPTEGKWAGRTFVSVQASDDFHPIRNAANRNAILTAIEAQGVKEAAKRYGLLIGRCGCCNRTLTDETSRAIGIGPVCREKYGF